MQTFTSSGAAMQSFNCKTGSSLTDHNRVSLSVNGGFDFHWNYATSAFPTYGTLRFNITEDGGDAFFVETSYGKMWRPSNNYPNGNYYGVGLGWQIAGESRLNTIVKIDFQRSNACFFDFSLLHFFQQLFSAVHNMPQFV